MRVQLDELDVRLLEALLENARASNRCIAQQVGLSESAALARLRKLEELGIIVGYQLQVAFERLGAFQCWADVELVDDEPSRIAAFEQVLLEEADIAAAFVIAGGAQFRLHVITSGFERRQSLAERLLARRDLVKAIDWRPIYKNSRVAGRLPRAVLARLLGADATEDV